MGDNSIAIVAVGALCPIGLDADMTTSSQLAGVSRKSESSVISHQLEPVILGRLPEDVLPPLADALGPGAGLTSLQARLVRIAAPALQKIHEKHPIENLPLILAGPAAAPGSPALVNETILETLAVQAGLSLDLDRSKVLTAGHAGIFEAIRQAADEHLGPADAPYVLVGGVDSFVDPRRLDGLLEDRRLLAYGLKDGFTPGEGAAFLLLATPRTCARERIAPLAKIVGVGLGHEKGHRYSDDTYTGDGLADAFREAFSQAKRAGLAHGVKTVFAGFNGEHYYAKEWGVASLRNSDNFEGKIVMQHPAENTGDMGAALGPVMLSVCAAGFIEGSVPGPALVWASSDGPQRGAALLTTGEANGTR